MTVRLTPRSSGMRAFEELRFGRARTLDLRTTKPSAREAESRVEAWLRERQVSAGGEMLVITGRGRGSFGGQAVVRPAVLRRLARLRRQGVVLAVREHTAGSFIVELASLSSMINAGRRDKDPPPREADTTALAGLAPATVAAVRALALRSLELLGAPQTDALIAHEMAHQFSRLAAAVADGADREARLRTAAHAARRELDDA